MQLGVLAGGAGVPTVLAGQAQCPGYLVLGDGESQADLQTIEVSVDGIPFISISNNALIKGFQQWQMEALTTLGTIANMFKVATGQIRKNTTIRFVNNAVGNPIIYGFSDGKDGVPIQATTKTINATSNETFDKFSALLVDVSAGSFDTAEITFADGHRETMTPPEVGALFALKFQCETANTDGGTLAGGDVLVIDNTDQSIQSVKINSGPQAQTVLVVKLPDSAFQLLKA